MKTLKIVAVAAAIAGSSLGASPSWAKTAFQYWAQGQGVYVNSKDHPSELYQLFGAPAGRPDLPPPYVDPYGRPLPPAAPYGDPNY